MPNTSLRDRLREEFKAEFRANWKAGDQDINAEIDWWLSKLESEIQGREVAGAIESILGYCGCWEGEDIISVRKKSGKEVSMRVDVFLKDFHFLKDFPTPVGDKQEKV